MQRPDLSVVVPSVNSWNDLRVCLRALADERRAMDLEVIIPERLGESIRSAIGREFPWTHVVPVAASTTVPQMRAAGMRLATAPTVVVIEDHIRVPSGWANAMRAARSDTARIVGGHLENTATQSLSDWAAWFCEYHTLATPLPAGIVPALHGNHTAYDRQLLESYWPVIESNHWEDALHIAAQVDGIALWSAPEIVAAHCMHYRFGEYLSHRFDYSRSYAAIRGRTMSRAHRILYGAATVALPPILLWRIIRHVRKNASHRTHLVRAIPLLAVFVVTWGLGEMAGAWFGDGGALARVK